jgi:hypothetical protein
MVILHCVIFVFFFGSLFTVSRAGAQSTVTGYVMQDDAFIETLTVAETLHYQVE